MEKEAGIHMSEKDLTPDQWRRLCLTAYENLPADTTITFGEIDAILTWCIPQYERLIQEREDCVSCAKGRGDCGHD